MNRIIFGGALALAVVVPGLMAQPKVKSAEEVEAVNGMLKATTADARIAACENLLTKFADSDYKSVALYYEALSYEQKGDYDHALVFGERTIQTDPKHYQAMLMLALEIAQHTKQYDLDKAEKLAQVDKYAKNALDLIKDAPKPNPNLSDDQWAGIKKDFVSQGHAAMGMAAQVDKRYSVAESEFKISIEGADKADAGTMVRLGKTYAEDGKYDDAIAQFDKVMAIPDVNPTVRQIAQAERVRTLQKKGGPTPATADPKADAPKPEAPKQ